MKQSKSPHAETGTMGSFGMFDPTANAFENKPAPKNKQRGNHGPSKGCEGCRRRKIKCDEKRPSCSRCNANGFSCEYRDLSRLIFRDETHSAARKVRRRLSAEEQDDGHPAPPTDVGLPKQLLVSTQETAIMRFFYDFVLDRPPNIPPSNPNAGFLALVPDMYRRCKPQSCFALSLSAAANANFWRRCSSLEARSNALKDCGKALQQLRKDLERCGEYHATANTMVATSLLAMYELIISRDVSQRTSRSAHVNGAVALLGNGQQNPSSETLATGGVLQPALSQMLIDCLVMSRHPNIEADRFSAVMEANPPVPLLWYMYRTAELCATWRDHNEMELITLQDFDIDDFLTTCQALDEEIETWMQERPDFNDVVVLENTKENVPAPLQPLFASVGAPSSLHICPDIAQTHRWHWYRACRLTLLRTMLSAVNAALCMAATGAALADYEVIKAGIHAHIIVLVDDLLSMAFSSLTVSVPGKAEPDSVADIQGFRGFQLLWPLHTAGNCLTAMGDHFPGGDEKMEWVRTTFRFIRDDLGIQTANNFLQVDEARRGETPSASSSS